MSRKFGGKCFRYEHRTVPEVPMVHIELGGMDGFDLSKSNPSIRDYEPVKLMRNRREGGYSEFFREGDGAECRSTLAGKWSAKNDERNKNRVNENH